MSGNQKAIEELEALYRDLLGMTEVGMLRTIAARITALKAEPEPDPSDTKELLMETQTSSSDSSASENAHGYLSRLLKHHAPQCEPFADLMGVCTQIDNLLVGVTKKVVPTSASADLVERLKSLRQHIRPGSEAAEWVVDKIDRILANAQPSSDTGTIYELAELRAERDALRAKLAKVQEALND